MTFLNALALAGIISAFVIFGVTLAWADYYSRSGPKQPGNVTAIKARAQDVESERRAA
jgi:hypothetical protein